VLQSVFAEAISLFSNGLLHKPPLLRICDKICKNIYTLNERKIIANNREIYDVETACNWPEIIWLRPRLLGRDNAVMVVRLQTSRLSGIS
jgi:hypothetical protein